MVLGRRLAPSIGRISSMNSISLIWNWLVQKDSCCVSHLVKRSFLSQWHNKKAVPVKKNQTPWPFYPLPLTWTKQFSRPKNPSRCFDDVKFGKFPDKTSRSRLHSHVKNQSFIFLEPQILEVLVQHNTQTKISSRKKITPRHSFWRSLSLVSPTWRLASFCSYSKFWTWKSVSRDGWVLGCWRYVNDQKNEGWKLHPWSLIIMVFLSNFTLWLIFRSSIAVNFRNFRG